MEFGVWLNMNRRTGSAGPLYSDVSVKGLSETAGVECTGSEALPETLKAIRNHFDDREEKLKAAISGYQARIKVLEKMVKNLSEKIQESSIPDDGIGIEFPPRV